MAAVCFRVRGLLSATVSRAAGLIVSCKTSIRSFHSSRRAFGELPSKSQPSEQVCEAEYIPTKKAKNPMKAVGIAWAIGFPCGIILFLLTKREVDKNRLKQLKVRQRIHASNKGEYKRERYRATSLATEELVEKKN